MLLFVAYVLIAILFWRLRELNERISELSYYVGSEVERNRTVYRDLEALRRDAETHTGASREPQPAPEPPPLPPAIPVMRVEIPEPAAEVEPVRPTPDPIEEPAASPVTPSEFLGQVAQSEGGWEQVIGGNVLNKLGAFVLVIGIALFLSYSFSNMGPAGRAFTALGISGAILAAGTLVEKNERYRAFSRGITATGWAGLYFTSYAMHSLPAARVIENPVLGTIVMCVTAVGMIAHALRYRVQSLAALTFGCLFGALALSEVNAFVTVALVPVAVAMLYLARRFEWNALALFAAAGTYAVFLTRPVSGAPLSSIQTMLVIYWTLFEAFDILRLRSGSATQLSRRLLFAVNAVAGLASSAMLWNRMAPDSMWLFCAGAAVLYVASMWIRFALDGETDYEISMAISALMAGLAIFAKVPGLWISLGLMLEAEALFLAAWALRMRLAKILSWVAFGVAVRHIAFSFFPMHQVSILNWFSVYETTPPLVIFAGLLYLNRYLSKNETYWSYPASAFVAVAAASETTRFPLIGFVWLAWSALLFEFGQRKQLTEFRIQAYIAGVIGIMAAAAGAFDVNPPTWAFAASAFGFFAQAIRATDWMPTLSDSERMWLRYGATSGVTLLAGLFVHLAVSGPYEGAALMGLSLVFIELGLRGWPAEMWRPAAMMNAAALFRIWITHLDGVHKQPEPAVAISFGGAALAYYLLTARFLKIEFVRTLCCAFAAGIALLTLWMLLPTALVPIAFAALAALTVELGIVAGADIVLEGRVLSGIAVLSLMFNVPTDLWPRVGTAAAVAAFQILTNFRMRREAAPAIHGIAAALIIAVTLFNEVSGGMLTLSWSLEGIALLAFGFMFRDRWLRLPGLVLLIVCIGKVFFYDLRNLETMYRILSFIGLGVILLAVSWIYTRFKEQMQRLL